MTHREGGATDGEGVEKSETGKAETGAVPTFSENPIQRGGSKRGERKTVDAVDLGKSQGKSEAVKAAIAPADPIAISPDRARLGWKPVIDDADPGIGFYAFAMRDLPDVLGGAGGGTSNSVELFAQSLAAAREQLQDLVRRKTPIMRRPTDPQPIEARPFAHRATNLSKRQRREMAEAQAAAAAAGDPLTYAKIDGPPADWHGLRIFDLDTGEEIQAVLEVDTVGGWLKRHALDPDGHPVLDGDEIQVERIEGRFEIRRPS